MSFRLSITQKGVALIAVPLLFELASLGFLSDCSSRAEQAARQAEHLRDISDTTNSLVKELYQIIGGINFKEMEKSGDFSGVAVDQEISISGQLKHLEDLTAGDARQHAVVLKSHQAFQQATAMVKEFGQAMEAHDSERCTRIRKQMKYVVRAMISRELIDLSKAAKGQQGESRELENRYREQVKIVLTVIVCGSIALSVLLAALVTRGFTRRLAHLGANALRVGRSEALPAPMSGNDEIADVDRAFHAMALALEESTHRERAVLENARDVICSIDKSGRIAAMNQASLSVLGYEPDSLMGRFYIDLVAKEDVPEVLKSVEQASRGAASQQFEGRMLKSDGRLVDLLWSTRWSEREQALFCVLHDITERNEAERLRQEVIAMVTHDLRTPITAIRHTVEMMSSGMVGDISADAGKMLKRVGVATTRMMLLINDLLDIEKIKTGMMRMECSLILVNELYELCSHTVEGLLAEKSIELVTDDSTLEVFADPDRIAQVLVNLVSNAVKFSKQGAKIELSAVVSGEYVEVSVRDFGRGIPSNMLSSIFDRFQQVEDADAREKGGSGLGLAICKAIVELHGGKIWAESVESQGSTFKFLVPSAPESSQASATQL